MSRSAVSRFSPLFGVEDICIAAAVILRPFITPFLSVPEVRYLDYHQGHSVPLEANGLEPVRKFEVEAPLSLRDQWSCEVDQHVTTGSENQTGHIASTPGCGGHPVPASQGSSGPSAVLPPAAPGRRARSILRRRRGGPLPNERLPGPQVWGSDRDRSSSSRPGPCCRHRSRAPSRPEGRRHSP